MEMVFTMEQRMVHSLMLRTLKTKDIGLLHGQIGVAICFFNYYRYTGNEIYEQYANLLLDNIFEHLAKDMSIDFESGLAGIGWGIEYMIQNGFVEGDSSDVCQELDEKIMMIDPYRIVDVSEEKGFSGLLAYVLIHMKSGNNIFDPEYIEAVQQMARKKINKDFDIISEAQLYSPKISKYIEALEMKEEELWNAPVGIKGGLAGTLLKNILTT